jgi:phospholipid/cholesterol/gamma-HCH transport system permease protein
MNVISRAGGGVVNRLRDLQHLLAVVTAVALLAVRPRHWPRTVRNVLARQILFTGVEAVWLVAAIAFVVGISLVLQAQVWLARVGQKQLLGPLLVVVIVREFAPILANLVVIIRSASAVAAEMANMQLSGEVRVLDAQGLDPLVYLVMPRVVGMAICVFGLALVFVVVSLFSGYLFGALLGTPIRPSDFADSILSSLGPADVLNLVAKSVLPAAVTATICCIEGLGAGTAATEIPRATSRGLQRSVISMFVIAAAVSVLTYL